MCRRLAFFVLFIYTFSAQAQQLQRFEVSGKVGIQNQDFRIIVPPLYQQVGWSLTDVKFHQETIPYQLNGLWGLLDANGKRITPPQYAHLLLAGEHIVAVQSSRAQKVKFYGIIDPRGEVLVPLLYADLKSANGALIAQKQGSAVASWGLISIQNQTELTFEYQEITPIGQHYLRLVNVNSKAGVYHVPTKKIIVSCQFDSLNLFNERLFIAYKGGLSTLLDINGKPIGVGEKSNIAITDSGIYQQNEWQWQILSQKGIEQARWAFRDIQELSTGIFLVRKGDKQALANAQGRVLHEYKDQLIPLDGSAFHKILVNGLWQLMNNEGDEMLPFAAQEILWENSFYFVYHQEEAQTGWSVFNSKLERINDDLFEEIAAPQNDYFKVMKRQKWGLMDLNGNLTVPCIYDQIEEVHYQKAVVEFRGAKGLIDMAGKWVILPNYKSIRMLTASVFLAKTLFDKHQIMDADKVYLETESQLGLFHNFLLETNIQGKLGLKTWLGKRVLACEFDSISPFINDSVAVIQKQGQWGAINAGGRLIIPPSLRFESISAFNEKLFLVKIQSNAGFVDQDAKLRISNQYQAALPFTQGRAAIKIRDRWGFIDKQEQIVCQPNYDGLTSYERGFSQVQVNGKWGLLNLDGKQTLASEYDSIIHLPNQHFIVMQNGRWGIANPKGFLMLSPKYDYLEALPNGHFKVGRRNKLGVIDQDGLDLIPIIYDQLVFDAIHQQYRALQIPRWEKLNY